MTNIEFENRVTELYLHIQSVELEDWQMKATKMNEAITLSNALIELKQSNKEDNKFKEMILSFLSKTVDLVQNPTDSAEWIRIFIPMEKEFLEPVKLYLLHKKGYVTNTYVPNVIGGVLADIFFIISTKIYFPLFTLIMICVKYFVVKYKRKKGKVLDY